jgi:hypothetical protein
VKRLTETNKWTDGWFRRLAPAQKLSWLYIVDACDNAGIWEVDFALLKTLTGATVKEQEIFTALRGRAREIPRHRWWIPRAIVFQNVQLSPNCKKHQQILELLKKNELLAQWNEFLAHPIENEPEEVEKEADDHAHDEQAEEIYAVYPLQTGKPKALSAIRSALKLETFEALMSKTKAFAASQPANLQFCPHASSWYNAARYNDDPRTWVRRDGKFQADLFAPPKKTLLQKEIEQLERKADRLL